MNEEALFQASLEDKLRQCTDNYTVTGTNFLDLHQRSVAESFCRKFAKDVRYMFYGGYENAERTILVFLPDYVSEDEFLTREDYMPLTGLRVKKSRGSKALTHRDYLGSLTALGLKREVMGDILVREDGADIVVLKDIAEFLVYNYNQAGRVALTAETVSLQELICPTESWHEEKDTVASLRLDNIIASAFYLSRSKASEAIRKGLVFVNNMEIQKTDFQIKEKDIVVLRGKGKARLKTLCGVTRKNRFAVIIERKQ